MKNKYKSLIRKTLNVCFVVLLINCSLYAQNGVGIGTTTPDTSSALEIYSNSQGLLIPRMSKNQRNAIPKPAHSLVIFQTDGVIGFYFNSGSPSVPVWDQLLPNPANTDLNLNNNKITNLIAPSASSDAVNKGYVDNLVAAQGGQGIPTMISLESAQKMSLANAMMYCDTLTEGGFNDWYVPSLDNLFYAASGGTTLPDQRSNNDIWTVSYVSGGYTYFINLSTAATSYSYPSTLVKCRCVR
jgi:hypothetical protein